MRLEDGTTVRINYDGYNGQPYTPVGRVLIERGEVPREQMSMERIRIWMNAHPDDAKALRDENRSYVFFRIVGLSGTEEARGAQGVPLTPGRSIAVDNALHVYGTPFFIQAALPLSQLGGNTAFHRAMIAQDTGSAILGPARADVFFGAGASLERSQADCAIRQNLPCWYPAALILRLPGARCHFRARARLRGIRIGNGWKRNRR